MKIKEIIGFLEKQGTWVDWNETRDIVLFGSEDNDITKVGICWVATNIAIKKAIDNGINFIITHENPFYNLSTAPKKQIVESVKYKKDLLKTNNITIYRCHDVWDKIPKVGVADTWAKIVGYDFKRDVSSYIQRATIDEITVKDLAKKIVGNLSSDGEDGVYIFGDINKSISKLAIGTGAATDIFKMLNEPCDACVVSDDGITNYYQAQYAIDNDIPLIVVNHSCSEIGGIKNMVGFLKNEFNGLDIQYLDEGYKVTYITK